MDLFNLKGKKAIITGGCGGIGRAISEGLYDAGAEIVIVDYSPNVMEVCKEIRKGEVPIYGIIGDLGNRQELKNVFQNAIDYLKTVDILVNCAGIQKRCKAEDFALDDWDKIIEINLTAVFQLCQLAGRIMIKIIEGSLIPDAIRIGKRNINNWVKK